MDWMVEIDKEYYLVVQQVEGNNIRNGYYFSISLYPNHFAYFGLLSDNGKDDKYKEHMENIIKIDASWEISHERRAVDENELYFPPYVIVIPEEDIWAYLGPMQGLFTPNNYGGSLPKERNC